MASINFNILKNTTNPSTNITFAPVSVTFVDLFLDLQKRYLKNDVQDVDTQDIRAAYDEEAIRNSLYNLFNTIPGQRFLLPEYGTNIWGYVFEPCTELLAREIGRTILRAIEQWEKRVQVDMVEVRARPDHHEYFITISLLIPKLKVKTNLTGVLSRGGFKESNM